MTNVIDNITTKQTMSYSEAKQRLVSLLSSQNYQQQNVQQNDAALLVTKKTRKTVVGWESLSKAYWTEIAGKIYEEEAAYEKVLKGEKLHEQIPTHLAIHQACNSVGFNILRITM